MDKEQIKNVTMMKADKTFFYLMMVVALVLGSTGCSSSEDEGQVSGIVGNWELRLYDRGWAQISEFQPQEVKCVFSQNGVVNVTNKSGIDLSPFLTDGTAYYSVDSNFSMTINGISFEYRLEGGVLYISQDVDADGPCYKFVNI